MWESSVWWESTAKVTGAFARQIYVVPAEGWLSGLSNKPNTEKALILQKTNACDSEGLLSQVRIHHLEELETLTGKELATLAVIPWIID